MLAVASERGDSTANHTLEHDIFSLISIKVSTYCNPQYVHHYGDTSD
ncbi:hypothetical protein [Bacillus sp. NSP9.1]|nr:hypothetical protein [Bacillus sp. NSP9.1]QHZ47209.1 hypothetical protein M654_013340 [Bacillus sp. NSP9.1]